MYRAGVEGILGLRREGEFLTVEPCIPATWSGFEATVTVGLGHYDISVETLSHTRGQEGHAALDGVSIICAEGRVRIPLRSGTHRLSMVVAPH
jgi:cyclic beta-1,2-glucan synthetase